MLKTATLRKSKGALYVITVICRERRLLEKQFGLPLVYFSNPLGCLVSSRGYLARHGKHFTDKTMEGMHLIQQEKHFWCLLLLTCL